MAANTEIVDAVRAGGFVVEFDIDRICSQVERAVVLEEGGREKMARLRKALADAAEVLAACGSAASEVPMLMAGANRDFPLSARDILVLAGVACEIGIDMGEGDIEAAERLGKAPAEVWSPEDF